MNKFAIQTLENRLDEIRAVHGDAVCVDDLGAIIAELVSSLDETGFGKAADVGVEVRDMLDFIARAKDELFRMRPKTMTDKHIACARDELDAVVSHTEEAAGRFMDAADRLSELAGRMNGEAGGQLMEISTGIFEASSFQDITGQRLAKVISVLRHLEDRLSVLADAIGDTVVHEDEAEEIFDEDGEVVNEEALKHGPQLNGLGNSQDDIDALLASFD